MEEIGLENLPSPIVCELDYKTDAIYNMEKNLNEKQLKYILEYPTVYIVNDKVGTQRFSVYIGETTNIKRRSFEHLQSDPIARSDWRKLADSSTAKMFVIGHNHFNKSLTLDIENKLMQYMSSVGIVDSVYNRRYNQQNQYYTSDELDSIFSKIWRKLHNKNKELFPVESVIRDSAIFKASPFHKLTQEQMDAKELIIMKIEQALNRQEDSQLILVQGEAGSGKTVLMSSLFYELQNISKENDNVILQGLSCYLLVNHEEQVKVYEQIATKLGIRTKSNKDVVSKPTHFINVNDPEEKIDVVLIDEAHLLLTQGKQSYRGKNHLKDILDRAKVVVAVFDKNQILTTEQYWESNELLSIVHKVNLQGNLINLGNQLRINAGKETVGWIRNIVDNQQITNIPTDTTGYDLEVFADVKKMYEAIRKKAENEDFGISRILATFDWPYSNQNKPKNDEYWRVKIGKWSLPWNLQLKPPKRTRVNKQLSWAEQSQTINEVGSTYTIQGFDLNYAAIIIGPSVKYRDGKVIFDKKASKNKKATQKRGGKKDVAEDLLKNELNVLLTRGVNGLYIYAVDDELQNMLLKAQRGELKNE